MSTTFEAIVEAKGGDTAFAEAVGVSVGTVRTWKWRKKPAKAAWLQINTAFPDLGLDVLQKLDAAA